MFHRSGNIFLTTTLRCYFSTNLSLNYMRQLNLLLLCILAYCCANAQTATNLIRDYNEFLAPLKAMKHPASMTYEASGETYLRANADRTKIIRYETKSGKELETVFDCSHTRETSISRFSGFIISPEGSRLLIYRDVEYIYRRSFTAEYFVFEISRNILLPLSTEHPRQQAPVVSPDGRMIAFVADNNIYLKKLTYNTETAVTKDGKKNEIINGVPDWVYEEEFATNCSMSWSPDCTTLCFLKYNETEVPLYSLPVYDSYCTPDKRYALYPDEYTYKYPVPGEKNSVVTLHSFDIDTRKTKQIVFEDKNIEYFPRIQFAPKDNILIVSTLNREQNRFNLYTVNPKSTVVKSLIVEESNTWVSDKTSENFILEDNCIILQSNRSGFNHLYEYSYSGAMNRQLTNGQFDVTAYYGKDRQGNVYYQSAATGPLNRVISRIDAKKNTVVNLTPEEGVANAVFAPGCAYYTLNFTDSSTPSRYTLISTAKNTELMVLQDNSAVAARFANAPQKEFFTVTSDGVTLNAYMIKPTDFNPNKKYPVIMTQYSGPGSQQVMNRWEVNWQFFAAEQGYIIVCVDGRGTGARGRDFEHIIYKNLGYYETIDQSNAAREIAALPYVDGNNIGMTGWSFGGYETLMSLTELNSPFKAGVAIAPVTDWRLYDTIYTERFMSTPQINDDGYNTSAPLDRVKNMNADLMIIYGTADDNVHPANSIEFISALQSQDKLCNMLVFPNMNHSINGCNSRAQVYCAMLRHFNNSLK